MSPEIAAKSSEDSRPSGKKNGSSHGIESGACPQETQHFPRKTASLPVIISDEISTEGETKAPELHHEFPSVLYWKKHRTMNHDLTDSYQ